MAVSNSVDPAAWLTADPDPRLDLVRTMAGDHGRGACVSGSLCGAACGERSNQRADYCNGYRKAGMGHPDRHRRAGHPQSCGGGRMSPQWLEHCRSVG